eukprot:8121902-Karenia_brevis.AAC.1
MPMLSVPTLPPYLGPCYYARMHAQKVFIKFLFERGGSATTDDLATLYAEKVWLQGVVGKLEDF